MIMRRRITRRTMGKDPIKKSTTLLANIGSSSPVTTVKLVTVPDRSAGGATQTIRADQTTDSEANVGDIVKYVNICIEAANRDANVEAVDSGWLEWAVGFQKETSGALAITNLGTKTLMDVAVKTLRGDCLMTGCIPIGSIQPITQNIIIKIPKNKVKLQLGSNMNLYCYFRSVESTDVRTDNVRLVASAIYKLYV